MCVCIDLAMGHLRLSIDRGMTCAGRLLLAARLQLPGPTAFVGMPGAPAFQSPRDSDEILGIIYG